MIIRLLYKNKIIVNYLPKILVKMRIGGISNYSIWNRLRGNNEDYLCWRMNGINPPLFIRFKKPLSKLSHFSKDQIYMKKILKYIWLDIMEW